MTKRQIVQVLIIVTCIFLITASLANAIIIRHDKKDALYIALGKKYKLLIQMDRIEGQGTLIAPNWVLTAAHVAEQMRKGRAVSFGGRKYTIIKRFLHPKWRGTRHDIALLKLGSSISQIKHVRLYRKKDEEGKVITFLGNGTFGTGTTGPKQKDGKIRGARNRIEKVNSAWLMFLFDKPETALDLEGATGKGDSGGPALIEENGILYIAGVSSTQSFNKDGLREGIYGVKEYFTRVSSYVDWIDSVIEKKSRSIDKSRIIK
jgi:hypothetical protein